MLGSAAATEECAACTPASCVTIRKVGALRGHKDRVFDMCWSPIQPGHLASVGQTGGFVWRGADGATEPPARLIGSELMRVCWHPDGVHVLTGSSGGKINVCSAADGATRAVLDASEEDEVYGLQPLSDEGLLAAGADRTVQLWDLNRAARIAQAQFATAAGGIVFGGPDRNPEGAAYLFSLAARGRALCAGLSDGTVRLIDAETLQTVAVLDEHARRGSPAFDVAISTTSPQLASADRKGSVLLWDQRHLGRGPFAEANHGGPVHAVAFVPGVGDEPAEMLATGGADATLRVHETRTAALATHGSVRVPNAILCLQAAPDGATPRVATAGGSGGFASDASISIWCLGAGSGAATDEDAAPAQAAESLPPAAGEAEPEGDAADECCGECR